VVPATGDITTILSRASHGDNDAVNRLFPLVYDELRGLADRALLHERRDHTLQPTALVHEAYIKLIGQEAVVWRDRAHFQALAAQAIRRILVDHARTKKREKRGGGWDRVPLHGNLTVDRRGDVDLVALDELLAALTVEHPRKALVVEMRFFGGMTATEVAEVIGVNLRSVERDWQFARAWLYRGLTARAAGATGDHHGNG
jgi:RNA polymerase sigma factor (TIGR02999 family)